MIPPDKADVNMNHRSERDFLSSYQETVHHWIGLVVSSQELLSKQAFGNLSVSEFSDRSVSSAHAQAVCVLDVSK